MRKFLASVGNAKLLGKVNGVLTHIADVRTLTESTLNFSSSMEEVRAGESAQLFGRFNHSAGLTVTLTDAMWDIKYIANQVGGGSIVDPTAMFQDAAVDYNSGEGTVTLSQTPQNIGQSCGLRDKVIWVRPAGCDADTAWAAVVLTDSNYNEATNTVTITGADNYAAISAAQGVCVEYFISKPEANSVLVNSTFIPAELVLILTTKLFAGDANAPETGKPVGTITVKIPRFQLDGTFDLAMAMSSAASMNLNGTALAVDNGSCDGAGIYAEIVEVITNSTVMTGLVDVVADPDDQIAGEQPVIYGRYSDGHISAIGPEFYTVAVNGGTGTISAKTLTDNVTNYITISGYVDENGNVVKGIAYTNDGSTILPASGTNVPKGGWIIGKNCFVEVIEASEISSND